MIRALAGKEPLPEARSKPSTRAWNERQSLRRQGVDVPLPTPQAGRTATGQFTNGHGVGASLADEEGVYTVKVCDACGSVNGIEPLYPVDVAAELIPFRTPHALRLWLHVHKDEFTTVRIRKYGWTKKRMLTRSEIFRIREKLMLPYSHGAGRPPSHSLVRVLRDSAIDEGEEAIHNIIREAMTPDDGPEGAVGAPPSQSASAAATQDGPAPQTE